MCKIIEQPSFPKVIPPKESFEQKKLEQLLLAAVQKRIPKQKFGVLFSGGVDSVLLAKACQKLGHFPELYVAAFEEKGIVPKDLANARTAAQELGLPLIEAKASFSEGKKMLSTIVSRIGSSNPIQVGMALSLSRACQKSRENNCTVLLAGLGADGLFGGFHRQKTSTNLNRDCQSRVQKARETDKHSAGIVTGQHAIELQLPFFDSELVSYALQIPAHQKINGNTNKKCLRALAIHWGISKGIALRPKKAMQYGSNADKLIEQLAKKQKLSKGVFLEQFLPQKMCLGALVSGGKDGWYAALIQQQKNDSIECLISMQSENPASFMFHTPNIGLVKLQSKASQIPLVLGKTKGEKEIELQDLKKTIQKAQKKFKLDGIVSGALLSNYQRERIERVCDELELKIFSPLWQKDQLQELEELLQNHFEVAFSSVASQGFSKEWLGKALTQETIQKLADLKEKLGVNPAGEGGEFETLVLDCPMFKKKIVVGKAKIQMQNECRGSWEVQGAKLAPKTSKN